MRVDKIKFVKERVDTFTNKTDEIQLFEMHSSVTSDELVSFCKSLKQQEFYGAMFHMFVFFDDEQYAEFPENPITAGYSLDEREKRKHIKAIYVYNQVNGFSELLIFDVNALDSEGKEIQI